MKRFFRGGTLLLAATLLSEMLTGFIPGNVLRADETNEVKCCSFDGLNSFDVTTDIRSSWSNHASVEFTFLNSGSETIHNWYFTFYMPYSIDEIWGASVVETDDNGTYTIKCTEGNQDISSGASVTVGMNLSGETEEVNSMPQWYLLNTKKILEDSSNYEAGFGIYSEWDNGFNGYISITPSKDLAGWSVNFSSNRTVTDVYSTVFQDNGEGNYTVSNDGYNRNIGSGEKVSYTVQGINSEEEWNISGIEIYTWGLGTTLTDDLNGNGVLDYLETVNPEDNQTEITDVPEPTIEPEITETPSIDMETDSDGDGIPDYYEDTIGTDKTNPDTDGDGLSDFTEVITGYNPLVSDTDLNGVTDSDEDFDGDGIINSEELVLGTDITLPDTDSDDLKDGDEINIYGTNPLKYDTDEDGISDGEEVHIGKNPNDSSDADVKVSQILTQEIDNSEDSGIISVDVEMELAGDIEYSVWIEDLYNIDCYSTDVYGRIGSPIGLNSEEEFDTSEVTIHYNEEALEDTEEENLGVLWYNEETGFYILQEQAEVDTENNEVTLELSHFSTYVLVDKNKWNNPAVPDYSNGMYVVHYEGNYYEHHWNPIEIPDYDTVEDNEYGWWHLSRTDTKVATLSRNIEYAGDNSYEHIYACTFEWLMMDETDSDGDGIPDFMETQGIVGTNGKIYYSDPNVAYTDGDGLTDGEEFGTVYELVRDGDNISVRVNGTEVFCTNQDTIFSFSQLYALNKYFEITGEVQRCYVCSIRSNPELTDSDGDEVPDSIDAYPFKVNPMINYLIVGTDNTNENTLEVTADYYETLFGENHMEYIKLKISDYDDFINIWQTLKCRHDQDTVSEKQYYSKVDNFIVITHGGMGYLSFGDDGITVEDVQNQLQQLQSAHINVVDYIACFSAHIENINNMAFYTMCYCDVDETYGFDGLSYFSSACNLNYYYCNESSGYIHYFRNRNGQIECEKVPEQYNILSLVPYTVFVSTCIHSTKSGA